MAWETKVIWVDEVADGRIKLKVPIVLLALGYDEGQTETLAGHTLVKQSPND